MGQAPSSSFRSFRLPLAAIALAAFAAAGLAAEDEKQLLDTTKTIIGQQITYPSGTAKVSASIITLRFCTTSASSTDGSTAITIFHTISR